MTAKIRVETKSGLKVYSEYEVLQVKENFGRFKKGDFYIIDCDYEWDIALTGIRGNSHSSLIYDNRGNRYPGFDALEADIFIVEKEG